MGRFSLTQVWSEVVFLCMSVFNSIGGRREACGRDGWSSPSPFPSPLLRRREWGWADRWNAFLGLHPAVLGFSPIEPLSVFIEAIRVTLSAVFGPHPLLWEVHLNFEYFMFLIPCCCWCKMEREIDVCITSNEVKYVVKEREFAIFLRIYPNPYLSELDF